MSLSPKILLIIILFASLGFFFNSDISEVKAMTVSELQALIAQLQAQIASLQQQITKSEPAVAVPWCHTFNVSMAFGNTGSEVKALQIALQKEGCLAAGVDYSAAAVNTFDQTTFAAVIKFQEKYKAEVLTPAGLKYGTGFVGAGTKAKLNKLYGCASTTALPSTPTSTPAATTTPVDTEGSLTLSLSSETPVSTVQVVGPVTNGLTNVVLEKIVFAANTAEDIYIKSIIIKRSGGRDTDFSTIHLWDGSTQIGDTQVLSYGSATFNLRAGYYWRIPKGTSKTLTVKANLRGIASQYITGSVTGDNPKLGIPTGGLVIQGVTSGRADLPIVGLSTDLYGNEIILRQSQPTIEAVDLTDTYLAVGDKTLYRWAVSADTKGNIGWKKIKFEVTGILNGVAVNSSQISEPKVFDVKTGNEILGSVAYADIPNGFAIIFETDQEQFIEAGQVKNYQLRANVLSVKSGDVISTKINSEAISFTAADYASVLTGSFIWSDRSAANHSEATSDWLNDYKIPNLPATTLSLLRGGEPEPTITVTYPNGGEQWEVGKNYRITWSSARLPVGAKISSIKLSYKNTGATYDTADTIVSYIDNAVGYYDWTVSQKYGIGIQPNTFSIKITYTAADGTTVEDSSNTYFNLIPAVVTQTGYLSVSLASDTPMPQSINKGSTNVVFLKAQFNANDVSDVQVTSLKVRVYKNGSASLDAGADISKIALYDGDTKISTYEAVSGNVATFSGLVWVITRNTTKTLTVKADISATCTAATLALEILGDTDVSALGINSSQISIISVDGSATGKTMTIAGLSFGEIENQLADLSRAVSNLFNKIKEIISR